MIKYIVLLVTLSITLFASNLSLEAKIITTILDNITLKEQKTIYADDAKLLALLQESYPTTTKREDATIFIINDKKDLPKNLKDKKIFVLNYQLLSQIPQSFGAFFFKKGRANIVLLRPQLKKEKITISKQLEPYVEERIW